MSARRGGVSPPSGEIKIMTFWCTMADRYRDQGGTPRVYCKFLGKMVELEYCKKEYTDRMPPTPTPVEEQRC